ncbi:MAG: hypothetical protein ACLFMT_02695 [Halobacteriales archaeon]
MTGVRGMRSTLLGYMMKEEWRLHSRLFGGWGFAGFPVFIFAVASGAYLLLGYSGFATADLEVGLHYVVLFLGFSVGSIGFVSRDAVENLLGETHLLVFSSRTLPLSNRDLVSAFVVKDLVYYLLLYMLPLTLALLPASYYYADPTSSYAVLLTSVTASFMLGVSLSFFGAVVYVRSRPAATAFGAAVAVVVAAAYVLGRWNVLVEFTPLGFYLDPGFTSLALGVAPVGVLLVAGVLAFRPSTASGVRSQGARYASLTHLTSFDSSGLTAKMLLDTTRSSGGVLKVFLSVGMLFLVFVFLVLYVDVVGEVVSSPGIAFATLLAISSVSVYHWLNRFDGVSDYTMLPLDVTDVIAAKARAELMLSLPASYVYLALGGALFGFGEMWLGAVVLPLLTLYFYGVTVYFTGLEPNELLLNSWLFGLFTVCVAVVAVPLFVASIAYVEYPLEITAFVLTWSVVTGGIGYLAYRRSKPRWLRRLG